MVQAQGRGVNFRGQMSTQPPLGTVLSVPQQPRCPNVHCEAASRGQEEFCMVISRVGAPVMVRTLSSVNHWACVFWILSMLRLLDTIINAASSVAVRVTLSGYCQCCVFCCVKSACSVYCQACISWLPLGLCLPVTSGVVFPGAVGIVFSGYHWSYLFWLPPRLHLSLTLLLSSLGVRAVKSPTQSGRGALRSVEFRLQRRGEAHDSSDPSFPHCACTCQAKLGSFPSVLLHDKLF